MAPVRKIYSHDRVARLYERKVDGHVRQRARMRLDVRVPGREQLLDPVAGEILGDIDELAAAVVAFPGVAFGVFVRQDGAQRLQHRGADEILRGDKLELRLLPLNLAADRAVD